MLARLKANGKLAMLSKIGKHADVLLQQSFLRVLALRVTPSPIKSVC